MSTQSMHHRPTRGGTERDVFSRASQRALAWKPGERHAVKTGHARRTRRAARQQLRKGAEL